MIAPWAAAQIRRGVEMARQVIRRERVAPRRGRGTYHDPYTLPELVRRAYDREIAAAERDGRIVRRPPRGPSGASDAQARS